MQRAFKSHHAPGFRPHMVADLLGVSLEGLRYWREQLEPRPMKSLYQGQHLLTFRCIKWLVQRREHSVRTLKRCQIGSMFTWWEQVGTRSAMKMWFILDTAKGEWYTLPRHEACPATGWDLDALPLEPVIIAHYKALEIHLGITLGGSEYDHCSGGYQVVS